MSKRSSRAAELKSRFHHANPGWGLSGEPKPRFKKGEPRRSKRVRRDPLSPSSMSQGRGAPIVQLLSARYPEGKHIYARLEALHDAVSDFNRRAARVRANALVGRHREQDTRQLSALLDRIRAEYEQLRGHATAGGGPADAVQALRGACETVGRRIARAHAGWSKWMQTAIPQLTTTDRGTRSKAPRGRTPRRKTRRSAS